MNLLLIPKGAKEIINRIRETGNEAFLVGGCVRDLIRDVKPHDWDISTNLLPAQVIELFGEENIIPTGLKHGTVTVKCENDFFEVTTYRIDGDYSDHRRPDTVLFCNSIQEDLSRRDFTINSMAMDLDGNIIDPFHGQIHLKNGIIKCVGSPSFRFAEDPLRILRALRFASTFGFKIDKDTAQAMKSNSFLIRKIAKERITNEFLKILSGKKPGELLSSHKDVLFQIIPELERCDGFEQNHPWHKYDVLEHILKTTDAVSVDGIIDEDDLPIIRMAALLHDIAKPICYTFIDGIGHFYGHEGVSEKKAQEILKNCFRFSNKQQAIILFLIKNHGSKLPATTKVARRWIAKYSKEKMLMLTILQTADILGSGLTEETKDLSSKEMQNVLRFQQVLLNMSPEKEVLETTDLALTGKDLIAIGFTEGKYLGSVLHILTQLVMEEKLENSHHILLEKAKEFLK